MTTDQYTPSPDAHAPLDQYLSETGYDVRRFKANLDIRDNDIWNDCYENLINSMIDYMETWNVQHGHYHARVGRITRGSALVIGLIAPFVTWVAVIAAL